VQVLVRASFMLTSTSLAVVRSRDLLVNRKIWK
jgi:hypothetical protein